MPRHRLTYKAKARLMAAAPDLLAACKMAHSALDRLMGDTDWPDPDAYEVKACHALRAAIAKATHPSLEGNRRC